MSQPSGQKSVLITGCSAGGIGDALAQCFHHRGFRVFATARNVFKIRHLKEMGMEAVELDVTDAVSIKKAVEHVKSSSSGTLDILVNNAAGAYSMPLLDADLDSVRKLFELNVFAVLATTKAFAPFLINSKGTILNISSIASCSPIPWHGPYCASKGAVTQMSDTLRLELAPFDVKVIVVITGSVRTNVYINDTATQLPENSIYAPVKDVIALHVSGKPQEPFMIDPKIFAEEVVKNVLKSQPTLRQWAGGRAAMMWAISTFLWATFWDLAFADTFGLTELKKRLQQTKRS